MDRMLRSGGFSSFSMSLAGVRDTDELRRSGFTDDEILRLIEGYGVPNLKVEFTVTKRDPERSLKIERIKALASGALTLGSHVKRLQLLPEELDDEQLPINLLKDRIVFKDQLTRKEAEDVQDEVRYRAVQNA